MQNWTRFEKQFFKFSKRKKETNMQFNFNNRNIKINLKQLDIQKYGYADFCDFFLIVFL